MDLENEIGLWNNTECEYFIVENSDPISGTKRTEFVGVTIFGWSPVSKSSVAGSILGNDFTGAGVIYPRFGFEPSG